MTNLKEKLNNGVLILDGAMGTELIAAGAPAGYNDKLNIKSPDIVRGVYKAYIDAGSDIIITNTFGANSITLARHELADKLNDINIAGAKIAREAASDDKYVLGDIGPTGDFLKPVGLGTPEQFEQAFAEQAKALVDGGVDGLIVETMTDIQELEFAVKAAQSAAGNLPVLASMSFDSAGGDFRTMMGVSVEAMVEKLLDLKIDGLGFNCGRMTLDDYIKLAQKIESLAGAADVILFAEPNAGLPEMVDDKAVYKVQPDEFAQALIKIKDAGFKILGGCCGTSPAHIKAATEALK